MAGLLFASAAQAKTLKLCGVEWPPFTFVEEGQIVKGISFDIYTEAFSRMDMRFDAKALPWPRCLELVSQGVFDGVIDNAALEPYVYGVHPTAVYPLAIYVREDFSEEKFSWEAMDSKIVGMVNGYDYTEAIRQFDKWIIDYATSDEAALQKLQQRRYNYALSDIFSAPILAENANLNIRMLTPLVDITHLYLVFNKDLSDVVMQYDQVIGEMIKEGIIDKIYQQYLPYGYDEILNMVEE